MISLTPNAEEQSSYIVLVSLFDENSDPVLSGAVNSISWELTDSLGAPINGRVNVSVDPASTFSIVLTGNDLSMPNPLIATRELTITCSYNSDEYGTLTLAEKLLFTINTAQGGGTVLLPAASETCNVYVWCFDEDGDTPLPSVTATAYLINNPVFHSGKALSAEVFDPIYDSTKGFLYWKIPRNVQAHLIVKECRLDHEVTIPDAESADVETLI